ncbi:MAG: hypothetical protein AB8I08_22740 [Sandaracinaceae bacterium]
MPALDRSQQELLGVFGQLERVQAQRIDPETATLRCRVFFVPPDRDRRTERGLLRQIVSPPASTR